LSQPLAVTISLGSSESVSALLDLPQDPRACLLLAHGAGAGMRHAFLANVASELSTLGIATLRYQFPYMERGSKRTDPPDVCHATVRAAVAEAARLVPNVPLFAGGKSFGGRMTSQAQALAPLPGVRGLVFFGFPLHPPKKPSDTRAAHLFDVKIPMLFLQGSRDEFAELPLLEPVIRKLGARATVKLFEQADHSLHVPARSGRTDAQVRSEALGIFSDWGRALVPAQ
jgi:predicted alpha/beta-hydrolase family hydrolase